MNTLGDVGAGHVLGRYELLMPIASGGMATVWAARLKGARGFTKIVAVKTMLQQLIEDDRFKDMFLDEANLAAQIRHPHVVEIMELGEIKQDDGQDVLYIVMEWVDGEPLSVLIKAAGKAGGIPLPIATRIISQACAGLHAAHELRDESSHLVGLVHRDVSPQNLLITFDGVVKVVDFGVAKAAGRASAETSAGQIKGKAAYMSPEQARGGDIDRRTDIFALGIILYMMTTGTHPFRGENDISTMYAITSDSPVAPPTQLVPSYPRTLERVVLKALAKDKNERFATANDFLRALDHALPASMRVSTDDVVADFMKKLLSARHEQRQKALKTAQRLADERSTGRTSMEISQADLASHSGFTPLSNPSLSALQRRRTSGELSPVSAGRSSVGSTSATSQPSVQLDESDIIAESRPRRGWALAAAGIVLVAAAAGGGFFALRPMRAVTVAPPPPPLSVAPSAAPTTSAPPAATSAVPVMPSALATAEPVDAGAPIVRLGMRPVGGMRPAARASAEPAAVPAAKSTAGSTFVSPVRNPGF